MKSPVIRVTAVNAPGRVFTVHAGDAWLELPLEWHPGVKAGDEFRLNFQKTEPGPPEVEKEHGHYVNEGCESHWVKD